MSLNSLSGHDFEDLVEKLIRKMGFVTEERKKSADGGVDLKVVNENPILKGSYIIQCKRYLKPIGESVIRDLYGVVTSERANKGILITNSSFTRSSKMFASNKPIELIGGVQLQDLIEQYLGKEEKSKEGKKLNVPQVYNFLFDSFEKTFFEHKRRHDEIINGKVNISLQHYQNINSFIKYCDYKAQNILRLTRSFKDLFRDLTSFLATVPKKPESLDYVETNQLKTQIGSLSSILSSLFDDVERQWIDAISVLPPDNLHPLHKSMVDIYETYYEGAENFLEDLSLALNNPMGYIQKRGDREELNKERPALVVEFLLSNKYISIFSSKLREAKLQYDFFYILLDGLQSILREIYKFVFK